MFIIALYNFAKILYELAKIIFYLPTALPVFHLTLLALLIICTLLLLTMKWYISLCNRVILTKTRRTSFTLQTGNIRKANLNFQANTIINLATYLGFFFKHLLKTKDVLFIIKKFVGLQITYNKSVMTQRSFLTTGFQNTKTSLVISIICKTK